MIGTKVLHAERLNHVHLHYAALAILMVGVFVWRLDALVTYPFMEDEILSIGVMRNIINTGLPTVEGGEIYWRAVIAHYLMAVPLLWMDVSEISTRLVNLGFNSLLISVAWLCGRNLAGLWGGWLAALFLSLSSFQGLYASMARFYMPFEFFFLVAIYLAGELFVAGQKKLAPWLFLVLFVVLQLHQLSLQIFPVIVLAVLCGKIKKEWWTHSRVLIASFILLLTAFISNFWTPPNSYIATVALPLSVGGINNHWAFISFFQKSVPLGVSLIILSSFPAMTNRNLYWRFYLSSWLFSMLCLSVLAPDEAPRYMLHLFPLGVVIAAATAVWAVLQLLNFRGFNRNFFVGEKCVMALALLLLVVAGTNLIMFDPLKIRSALFAQRVFLDQKPAHLYIKNRIQPEEIIISTEPSLSSFYLEREVDYQLREAYDDKSGSYNPYTENVRKDKKYYFIDSPKKLREVLSQTHGGIWLYASWKIVWCISPETDRIIRERFIPKYSYEQTYVLYRPPVD